MDWLTFDSNLTSLFLLSFLAATLVPMGSEWLLILLVSQGFKIEHIVGVATLGNFLGACTTYLIGYWGSDLIIKKILRISKENLSRAKLIYSRYGLWSLFFSWLPVIGDPLCLVGGIFRVNFTMFSVLVFSGKFLRYLSVAYLTSLAIS